MLYFQSALKEKEAGGFLAYNRSFDAFFPTINFPDQKILLFKYPISFSIFSQDSEGRTPLHIAITTKNPIITRILLSHPELNFSLKDRLGQTPFVVAMSCRDNDVAASILAREPAAAEQVRLIHRDDAENFVLVSLVLI